MQDTSVKGRKLRFEGLGCLVIFLHCFLITQCISPNLPQFNSSNNDTDCAGIKSWVRVGINCARGGGGGTGGRDLYSEQKPSIRNLLKTAVGNAREKRI